MNTHTSQVMNPLTRIRPRSSTAKFFEGIEGVKTHEGEKGTGYPKVARPLI